MVRYIVDKDKKVVVAILETVNKEGENVTSYDAFRKLYKIVGHDNFNHLTHPELLMNKRYTAKATCDDEDEFDVEVGKKIALERVKKKYFAALDRRIINYYNSLKQEVGVIYDFFHRNSEGENYVN